MVNSSPRLEYLQTKRDDLNKTCQQAQAEIGAADFLEKKRLENRLDILFGDIEKVNQDIEKEQKDLNDKLIKKEFEDFVDILKFSESQWEKIQQAYHNTLLHWPVRVKQNVDDVQSIVAELNKIPQGTFTYRALEEFIAHLVKDISDIALSNALTQWGKKYHKDVDWLQLYEQIQAAQDKRLENAHPAILITITRSDEASTQTQDASIYYQVNAWLVEDIKLYKEQKTGYHSLILTDTPDAQPLLLENLLKKMSNLLNSFLTEKNRICKHCINYPQIHVFLPIELMYLDVDLWQLNAGESRHKEYLGHDHVVVVRCANRYEGNYRKAPSWHKIWQKHQSLLKDSASDVLVPGHDNDLDALIEILDNAVAPKDSKFVGLQLTQAPLDTKELCYEILDSGLPIAIWQRSDLKQVVEGADLPTLLTESSLEKLPLVIQGKRHETRLRRNSSDRHIGHHLSLLWDDPFLVPPKSS